MADEVKVPISLEITDLDTSQITQGAISKKLSGIKKAISSVFSSAGDSKFGQAISKAVKPVREILQASKKMTAEEHRAAQAAWKQSDAYKKAVAYNKALDKNIREVIESWQEFGRGKSPIVDKEFQEEINRLESQRMSTAMPEQENAFTRLRNKIKETKAAMAELASQYKQDQEAAQRNQAKFDKYQEDINKTKELLALEKQRHAELKKQSDAERTTYRRQVDPTKKAAALEQWNATKAQLAQSGAAISAYEAKLNKVPATTQKFNAFQQSIAADASNVKNKYNELGAQLSQTQKKLFGLNAGKGLIGVFGGIGKAIGGVISNLFKMKKTSRSTTGSMHKGFKKLGRNILMFGLGFRSIYYLVKRLRTVVKKDFGIMAAYFDEINRPLSELLTAFNRLKGSLGTALQPIISAIVPMLKTLVDYLSVAAEKVGAFFAVMTGQDYIYKAKANQKDFATAINGTSKTADYDQLKVIGDSQDIDYEKVAIDSQAISEAHGELLNTLKGFASTLGKIWNGLKPIVAKIMPFMEKLVNNLLPVIGEVVDAIMPVISDTLPPVIDLLTDLAISVLPVIVSLIQTLSPIVSKIVQMILPVLQKVLTALQPIFDSLATKVFPLISKLLDAILPLVDGILSCVADLLTPILELITPLLDLVTIILEPIVNLLRPILKILGSLFAAIGKILGPIIELLSPLLQLVNEVLEPIISLSQMIAGPIFDALGNVITWLIDLNADLVNFGIGILVDAIQWLVDKVGIVSSAFKSAFNGVKNAVKGAWDFIKNIFNSIIGGIEKLANGAVSGINKMIDALNTLSFEVPDWVPLIGGNKFGFNLPRIREVSIPRLAQGAVLPPNREFLATLGDQRHGTNVEAPLETIKQALIEALAEAGGSHQPIVLKLDGKTVAQVVWDQNEKRYKQTGKLAYSI